MGIINTGWSPVHASTNHDPDKVAKYNADGKLTSVTPSLTETEHDIVSTIKYVHDYIDQVVDPKLDAIVAGEIDLNNVELTGVTTADTAPVGDNSMRVATTEFVTTAIENSSNIVPDSAQIMRTVTLYRDGWTQNGTDYTQTVVIANLEDYHMIDIHTTSELLEALSVNNIEGLIPSTVDGAAVFTCMGGVPLVDINISVSLVTTTRIAGEQVSRHVPYVTTVVLSETNWTQHGTNYTQTVIIDSLDESQRIDVHATPELMRQLTSDRIRAIIPSNNEGIAEFTSFGGVPSVDLTIPISLVSVIV